MLYHHRLQPFFNYCVYSLSTYVLSSSFMFLFSPSSLPCPGFHDPQCFPFSQYVCKCTSIFDACVFASRHKRDCALTVIGSHSVQCDTDVGAHVTHLALPQRAGHVSVTFGQPYEIFSSFCCCKEFIYVK